MSEQKFSAGPWRQELPPPGFRFSATNDRIVYAADGMAVAMVIHDAPPEAKPNAHLIAAAPELYEACWVALEYCRSGRDTDSNEGEGIMNILIAALAKADGER